ncbi:glycosyltransferase family 4 protein, partial [Streptomyces sp. ACA25]|uniref:glycosyltransferase family 4 protein n=1 Tax=Streptomyces sp. ACA25 TaxID=3022596 RepID=UPI00230762DA
MSTTPLSPRARGPLHVVQLVGAGSAGTGEHVRSLAAGLVARGVLVTVCARPGVAERYGYSGTGARLAVLPFHVLSRAITRVRAVSADADLVHAHGMRAGLLAALALRRRGLPLVVTWHTRSAVGGARSRLGRFGERRVARAASVVLGATSDLVERARRRGARDARLAPVALPGPWESAEGGEGEPDPHKIRAALGAAGHPLIVTAGPLTADQGHHVLLTALRGLGPQPPLLLIVGEGPERAVLQRRIDRERLPVRLLGDREDLPQLLAAADVMVLASRWEARSAPAQEALRRGVPLVATEVGGTPELVGGAAVLVPFGDPEALGAAVAGLLADPARRRALAEAGRRRAARWPTEHSTVAQVLSIYDELTAP